MRVLHALVVTITLAGVAHAQTATQEMAPADVNKWINFFDKLVTVVVKTQTTCERMALDVSDLVDQNKDAIAVAKAARKQGKKLPAHAQQHMIEGVKKMVPAMQKCGQNEAVRAAFAKLDLSRK